MTFRDIRIHSVESSIPYVGMLTNSKYQIFVWMMFMTLLGCKLSAWVKKIWIFSFWLFSDTPYYIVVKSQQKSKFSILIQLVKAYISFCELIFGLIYIKIITLGVDIYIFWYNSVWHSAFLARNFPICKYRKVLNCTIAKNMIPSSTSDSHSSIRSVVYGSFI